MSVGHKQVLLSRFFNENVQLVAKMCPRCYEESTDVRILGVNLSFLFQAHHDIAMKVFDAVNDDDRSVRDLEDNEDQFLGFTEKQIDESIMHNDNLQRGLRVMEKLLVDTKKVTEKNDGNNNVDAEGFLGFTIEDADNSRRDYKGFVEAKSVIRHKIYKRVSLKCVKNNNFNKNSIRHRKTNRRKFVIKEEKESAYFKSEPAFSKYFPLSSNFNERLLTVKEEIAEVKQCEHLTEDLKSIKIEPVMVDHESQYFQGLNGNRIGIKQDPHLVVKKENPEVEKPSLWVPPRSPHNLIEEVLYHDPWALLVATIFLNRTSCLCARPCVFWFLTENPAPLTVLEKYPRDLEKYFVQLGLQRTRAAQVWRMSHDFVHKKWSDVKELYGIGRYGEDAYRMFCLGDFSVAPKDRFLRIYKAWYEKIAMGEDCKPPNRGLGFEFGCDKILANAI